MISSIFPNTKNVKELNEILNVNPEPQSTWWQKNGQPLSIKRFLSFASQHVYIFLINVISNCITQSLVH